MAHSQCVQNEKKANKLVEENSQKITELLGEVELLKKQSSGIETWKSHYCEHKRAEDYKSSFSSVDVDLKKTRAIVVELQKLIESSRRLKMMPLHKLGRPSKKPRKFMLNLNNLILKSPS
ncbi:hypothetical protein NE237_024751 [Protea cynaroides]|uniref:Uncharacterized protein n=1 Tax=Protea cynaroides TaxID=273540 RepID=A0A9Q0H3Y2_9MAGN|nr:hypothetical protein NE237_024751 [Protea cynaroides]